LPLQLAVVCLVAAFPGSSSGADVYVHDHAASEIFAYADTVPTLLNPTTPLQANGLALDQFGKLLLATAMPGSCVVRFDPETEQLSVSRTR
jgi:hypothetical protein